MHNRIVMPSTGRRAMAATSTSSSSGRTLLFRRSPMTTCPGPFYRPRTAVTAPGIPSVARSNVARRTFYTPEPDLEPKFTPTEELILDATAWTIAAVLAYSTFVLYADDDEDDDEHLLDAHNEERNKYRQEQKEFHERRRAMKERTDQERLDRTRLRRQQRSGQAAAATAVCHEETGADRRREAKADVDENLERK